MGPFRCLSAYTCNATVIRYTLVFTIGMRIIRIRRCLCVCIRTQNINNFMLFALIYPSSLCAVVLCAYSGFSCYLCTHQIAIQLSRIFEFYFSIYITFSVQLEARKHSPYVFRFCILRIVSCTHRSMYTERNRD